MPAYKECISRYITSFFSHNTLRWLFLFSLLLGMNVQASVNADEYPQPTEHENYYCETDFTLITNAQGQACEKTTVYPATQTLNNECDSGFILSADNQSCSKTDSLPAQVLITYHCDSDFSYNENSLKCEQTQTKSLPFNTYGCLAGYQRQGDTCVKPEQKSAQPYTDYYCPAGTTVFDNQCLTTDYQNLLSKTHQQCVSGYVLNGNRCERHEQIAVTPVDHYSCPAGYSRSGTTCSKTETKGLSSFTEYYCVSGYTRSGNSCVRNESKAATPIDNYSCPIGYSRSGTTCSKYETQNLLSNTTYSCPSGYSRSGTTCTKITTKTATRNQSSYCPSGYSRVGSVCNKYTAYSSRPPAGLSCQQTGRSSWLCTVTTSLVYGTPYYSCDSGWSLNGTTCSKTYRQNANANTTTYCPSGWSKTPSGYDHYGPTGYHCARTLTLAANHSRTYHCDSGWSKNSTTCNRTLSRALSTRPYQACDAGWTKFQSGPSSYLCKRTLTETANYQRLYQCPTGYQQLGMACHRTLTQTPTQVTEHYCASGYQKVANGPNSYHCRKQTYSNKLAQTKYRCDSGWSLNGQQCSRSLTHSYTTINNQCEAGWQWIPNGQQGLCQKVNTQSAFTQNNYHCQDLNEGSGALWQLIGQQCQRERTEASISSIAYTCSDESHTLNDQSCTDIATVPATPEVSYHCPSGYQLDDEQCLPVQFPDAPVVNSVAPTNENVGLVPGEAGMSGGAATYQVPISLPPGRHGMQPKLALNYSSRAGNGILGVGWSISGTSQIQRCDQTIAHEGRARPFDFSADDKLCLDGMRLVLESGNYGSSGATYRPELAPDTLVEQLGGSIDSNYANFIVTKRNGHQLFYGENSNGRIKVEGQTPALSWVLQRELDTYQNNIIYQYDTGDYGQALLTHAYYTGQGTNQGSREVHFIYQPRPDWASGYRQGGYSVLKKRLEAIETYTPDGKAFSYQLNYGETNDTSQATGRSLLRGIKMCGHLNGEDICLPETTFEWQEAAPEFETCDIAIPSNTFHDAEVAPRTRGDFNGDGVKDLLYQNADREWEIGLIRPNCELEILTLQGVVDLQTSNDARNYADIDFNRDGKTDFVARQANGDLAFVYLDEMDQPQLVNTNIPIPSNNTQGLVVPKADYDGDGTVDAIVVQPHSENGNATVTLYHQCGNNWQCIATELDDNLPIGGAPYLTYKSRFMSAGDLDGNGIGDFFLYRYLAHGGGQLDRYLDGVYLISTDPDGEVSWQFKQTEHLGLPNFEADFIIARHDHFLDVNGDGLDDFVTPHEDIEWAIFINQGLNAAGNLRFSTPHFTGFTKYHFPTLSDGLTPAADRAEPQYAQPLDYDADGRVELLMPAGEVGEHCESRGWPEPRRYCTAGGTVFDWQTFNWKLLRFVEVDGGWQIEEETTPLVAKVETLKAQGLLGDGLTHFLDNDPYDIVYDDDPKAWGIVSLKRDYYIRRNVSGVPDMLTAVVEGDSTALEKRAEWAYQPLSIGGDLYDDARDQVLEQDDAFPFTSSMHVVSDMYQSDGLGEMRHTSYYYEGAVYNHQGRGFQGFWRITNNLNTEGLAVQTTYHQSFPLAGRPELSEKYVIDGNNTLEQQRYRYSLNPSGRGHWMPYADKVEALRFDLLDGHQISQTTTTQAQDEYGVVQWQEQVLSDDMLNEHRKRSEFFYDEHDLIANWLDKLDNKTETSSTSYVNDPQADDAANDISLRTAITWFDQRQPNTITVTDEHNEGADLTTSYLYDGYGNPRSEQKSGSMPDPAASVQGDRTITTTYSSDGYFAQSQYNSLWLQSQDKNRVDTDPATGQPVATTDSNGNTTDFTMDSLGRVIEVNAPGVPTVYIGMQWCSGCEHNAAMRKVTRQAGSPEQVEYADKLGRPVMHTSEGFIDDSLIVSYKTYNALGQITQEAAPHYENDVASITKYSSHDVLGRPGYKTVDQGIIDYSVDYSYDGLTTHVTVNPADGDILAMAYTHDSLGRLSDSTDNTQRTTDFRYNAAGQPVLIRDGYGNLTTASYNGFGHKNQINDPNMGIWQYSYNALGELRHQTDANGTVTQLSYDALGRIRSRSVTSEPLSQWFYDTAALGVLDYSSKDNFRRDISYDGLQRPMTETTQIGSESFVQHIRYDNYYGRVKGVQYPGGDLLAYGYNSRGFMTREYEPTGNQTYRQITKMDVNGQINQQAFGNGLYQDVLRDPRSGLATNICVSRSTDCNFNSSVQHISYTQYDSYGNLKAQQRAFDDLTITEEFTYDSLHRLKSSTRGWHGWYLPQTPHSTIDYDYDDMGNLQLKSDYATDYRYGNASKSAGGKAGAHAVRQITKVGSNRVVNLSYDNNGNLTDDGDGRSIDYTGFNKPSEIIANGTTLTFAYDPEHSRYLQHKQSAAGNETIYYVGDKYQKIVADDGLVTERSYLGDYAMLLRNGDNCQYQGCVRYLHGDRLGSVDTITDGSGNVRQRREFDPFGKARDTYSDNSLGGKLSSEITDRGFTQHEHLDDVALIHMNGRAYDYNLGRFLSVDPVIQAPENSQSLNPYSYIMNNPLAGTDPSGYYSVVRVEGRIHSKQLANADAAGAQSQMSGAISVGMKSVSGSNGGKSKGSNTDPGAKTATPAADIESTKDKPQGNEGGAYADDSEYLASSCSECRYFHGNDGGIAGSPRVGGLTPEQQLNISGNAAVEAAVYGALIFSGMAVESLIVRYISADAIVLFNVASSGGDPENLVMMRGANVAKVAGSGPGKGFIEVSANHVSSKAVQKLSNSKPIDFIFDPKSQRFIMGNNPLGHDGIRMAGGIGHKEIVGGSIWRQNGKLRTDQSSGHYGTNWTAKVREQFVTFMSQNGVDVSHSATYRK
ncbi:hypothetical protein EZV61_02355 [Corallincola luteus]|uniref:Bacterial toxin 43 domain-containing protein n=1 Tax=Corallincola luteus TaxID=1775177 RepID=A0ABY2ANQ2_9GAMM|nr:polymorphic toxin type 43 domain-containing protein [Corallincola luteus]TCI04835.1 hypothetical protein EZV61_02355 [Corallincola luteus]